MVSALNGADAMRALFYLRAAPGLFYVLRESLSEGLYFVPVKVLTTGGIPLLHSIAKLGVGVMGSIPGQS